ncbi:MAG: sulfurtransferase TusA family protein [Candidatus Abyssobacteria bacterium SURF_5]|uniref:Sulfurtransferase TusA family protein n=1 Tax=Abyssobacteria bacterium (strain SURF_5) TaxID=2093360 RepID=A0A3A4NHC1_ABYX5|nr:MAG: sulfurtransferase TusA family protein [Candidatus Abyssubacteria bacterium SURF_5]
MGTEHTPDKELNLKGEICPYTFVRSKLAIEEMRPGQILRVIVDYEPATRNVPRSMENEGNEILGVSKVNDSDWQILILKANA